MYCMDYYSCYIYMVDPALSRKIHEASFGEMQFAPENHLTLVHY